MTQEERDAAVMAMDPSQKIAARRYLRRIRWLLVILTVIAGYLPAVWLIGLIWIQGILPLWTKAEMGALGVIGGADGPTAIVVVSSSPLPIWVQFLVMTAIAAVCLTLALRVWKIEKKLK